MRRFFIICLLLAFWSDRAWSGDELSLSFHMALASQGQSIIGGTLVNRGDSPVAQGYIVVTLFDVRCSPLESAIGVFGSIASGKKISIRLPVTSGFSSYQVTSMAAFSPKGESIPVVDDNADVLAQRLAIEREKCSTSPGS